MCRIEVVMDVATIFVLSSEACVSLKYSWMQLHVYVCIFRSMCLIEVVMNVCICVLSSEAWVSLK